jgi:uncharacterized protein (TIGR03382 family)
MSSVDEVERRRRDVEAAREELARSVDQLSGKAIATRNDLRDRLVEHAVPIAVGVAGLIVVGALRRRRRRRKAVRLF